jgi:hypothetical protein
MLCLFLLEMGMTASKKLKDLKAAGWRFILFGLLAPNIFATAGICVAHAFSLITSSPLQLGTYALFAVLCAAASYIAVPAIQRLAIPGGESDVAAGSLFGTDVLIQLDHRNSRHYDCPSRHHGDSGRRPLIAKSSATRCIVVVHCLIVPRRRSTTPHSN